MRSSAAAVLLLLAAPAFARGRKSEPLPSGAELLARALAKPTFSYEGRLLLDGRPLRVRFEPPAKYRRETLNEAGKPAAIVVSDGATEWVYDKARRTVWQGEPADAAASRLGADDAQSLLEANYRVSVSTAERVARRAAWLLELRSRFDGALQRRLWVDRKTGLVLESQAFAPDGRAASEMAFQTVSFPKKPQNAKFFSFKVPRGAAVVARAGADRKALSQAKGLSGLEPRTPAWLPSGYVFESLDVLPRGDKKILHFRYSDGVNALSLFQCPPRVRLDFGEAAGRRVRLARGEATLASTKDGNVLGWTFGRAQFVLVGPVAAESLERMADSLR